MNKKYKVKTMKFSELEPLLVIPKFQRSPVWTSEKKKNLIETIKKQLPIGSLLLSESSENPSTKYILIDGLQRITTLKDFGKNRFKYVDEKEINREIIDRIVNSDEEEKSTAESLLQHREVFFEEVKRIIIDSFHDNSNKTINDISWSLTERLMEEAAFSKYKPQKLQKVAYSIVKEINDILDINEIELPIIIFKSTNENSNADLIEIFTKVNSAGVQLSKYDIYAASWNNIEIPIDANDKHGRDILEAVIEKYNDSSEKSGLEISGFDADELKNNGTINIFEYAYALAKVISKKSRFLIKETDASKVDSLGFTLLAGTFNIFNKEMYRLGDEVKKYNIDFVALSETFIKTVEELEKTLEPWVKSVDNKTFLAHSELQLASYIITLHRLNYAVTQTGISPVKYKKERDRFNLYLHKYYLYDILRSFWAGSGDSKLDDILKKKIEENRYLHDIDISEYQSLISSWLNEQNEKSNISIATEVKLFINYIHRRKYEQNSIFFAPNKKFDFDHIITKKQLKEKFTNNQIEVPISTPCNLSYIGSFGNRSKKESTYYQWEKEKGEQTFNKDYLAMVSYPEKSEIDFVNYSEQFNKESYLNFLKNRTNYLCNEIIKILYK